MDITDVTREFTREKQQKLFSANFWGHVQYQRRQLNGGGRGDGGGRTPQQIASVTDEGEESDNAPTEGADNSGRGGEVQGHKNGRGFGRGRAGH